MMKLLLAVIATCALVVSPTCIKIKHQLRSNAPTIHVLISNGNTQLTSPVGRNGSHRFITDNLSSMTLAPAGSQTIQLSYDQIFPLTDAAVCTEVHPLSAGGCADGVCCKISISMYTITDAIIMTARVNNRKADGNPQFWKCEQEIQVPGVANTEASLEELVTDILHGEQYTSYQTCVADCKSDWHAECVNQGGYSCNCNEGYVNFPSGNVQYPDYVEGDTCHAVCNTNEDCSWGTCNDAYHNGVATGGKGCKCIDDFITFDGGRTCQADCSDGGVCGDTSVCSEQSVCICNDGYITGSLDGNGVTTCLPECDLAGNYAHCAANPDNSDHGRCNGGYRGDGEQCDDIDECDEGTLTCTGSNQECENTPGSASCVCSDGYSLDRGSCKDDNECAGTDHGCDIDNGQYVGTEVCNNIPGSYFCDCKSGYDDSGTGCTDNDECSDGTHTCVTEANNDGTNNIATCHNTPGSYTCTCNSEDYGDGKTTGTGGTGCRPKKDNGDDCTDNDGNPDNEQCISGVCKDGPTGYRCEACTDNVQCSTGQCSTDGVCVCTDDGHCSTGETCTEGVCV